MVACIPSRVFCLSEGLFCLLISRLPSPIVCAWEAGSGLLARWLLLAFCFALLGLLALVLLAFAY